MELGNALYAIRLGVKRTLPRTLRDFTVEDLENWPSVWIIVNNHVDVQLVAFERDNKVFQRTATVAKILETECVNVFWTPGPTF
jgi:hypothetical protein